MGQKNIINGTCTNCGRTGYWCRCGEYVIVSHPLTREQVAAIVATVQAQTS